MSAVVLDFFEWKFNHRIVMFKSRSDMYRNYLEMELAEALRKDTESITSHATFDILE